MKTKSIITFALAFLFSALLFAQESDEEMKLLFYKKDKPGKDKIANGGYGSFSVGWTQVDKKNSAIFGGRIAWIANHHFALGLAGYGFVSDFYNGNDYDPSNYFLGGGYGGIHFEPIIAPMSPVHVSFPILIGAGGVTAAPPGNWDSYDQGYYYDYYYDSDFYFVLQPGVEAEFNIAKFFRVAIGGSYRWTDGINLQYKYLDDNNLEQSISVSKNALDAFSANITFKFGWF